MREYMASIPRAKAKEFFREFIDTQSNLLPTIVAELNSNGVVTNPLSKALERYSSQYIDTTRPEFLPWSDDAPDWIKSSPEQSRGQKVYSDEAKIAFLRLGYFFGEALREACPNLYWAIGDRKTVNDNSPVLAGFRGGMECNTIVVCSVAMSKVHDGIAGIETFTDLFDTWKEECEES